MKNQELAKIFYEIAGYLEIDEVPFKPQAYEKVAEVLNTMAEDIEEIYEKEGIKGIEDVPGVGKNIAKKIEEYLQTGKSTYLDKLRKKIPVDITALLAIEGLGPKKIKKLYEELEIRNIDDLKEAIKKEKIRNIPGFGEKSEESLKKSIGFLEKGKGRFILGFIYDDIESIRRKLMAVSGVIKVDIAGSSRRMRETIGDLDILVSVRRDATKRTKKGIMEYFTSMSEVSYIHAYGESKSSVRLSAGYDADLRIFTEEEYGAGLLYFTGSKDHNIWLRKRAIEKGLKLNEYGLYESDTGRLIVGKTEKDIYKKLGLPFIPPEIRERFIDDSNLNDLKGIKNLIDYKDLKGDLQVQTDWSDGENSLQECARQAISMGYGYILITDHSKRLGVAHGLDEKRIKEQWKEIDKVNDKLAKEGISFVILKGIECDIMKDGSLDLSDKILSKLDLVGVSVHSYFNLPLAEQTKRLIKAMENRNVDIVFHPTARQINQREDICLNVTLIFNRSKETCTSL